MPTATTTPGPSHQAKLPRFRGDVSRNCAGRLRGNALVNLCRASLASGSGSPPCGESRSRPGRSRASNPAPQAHSPPRSRRMPGMRPFRFLATVEEYGGLSELTASTPGALRPRQPRRKSRGSARPPVTASANWNSTPTPRAGRRSSPTTRAPRRAAAPIASVSKPASS